MQLTVNGQNLEIQEGLTLGQFLAARDLRPQMIVVERNGEILRREAYDQTVLESGDSLEIVQMTAGG